MPSHASAPAKCAGSEMHPAGSNAAVAATMPKAAAPASTVNGTNKARRSRCRHTTCNASTNSAPTTASDHSDAPTAPSMAADTSSSAAEMPSRRRAEPAGITLTTAGPAANTISGNSMLA